MKSCQILELFIIQIIISCGVYSIITCRLFKLVSSPPYSFEELVMQYQKTYLLGQNHSWAQNRYFVTSYHYIVACCRYTDKTN
jgi:hypothetical protein